MNWCDIVSKTVAVPIILPRETYYGYGGADYENRWLSLRLRPSQKSRRVCTAHYRHVATRITTLSPACDAQTHAFLAAIEKERCAMHTYETESCVYLSIASHVYSIDSKLHTRSRQAPFRR